MWHTLQVLLSQEHVSLVQKVAGSAGDGAETCGSSNGGMADGLG